MTPAPREFDEKGNHSRTRTTGAWADTTPHYPASRTTARLRTADQKDVCGVQQRPASAGISKGGDLRTVAKKKAKKKASKKKH
jgi:hypothetical protein